MLNIKNCELFSEKKIRERLRECYNNPAFYKGRKVISTLFYNGSTNAPFYIKYIKAENICYIDYNGENIKSFSGTPIMIYCDLLEFIDNNVKFSYNA